MSLIDKILVNKVLDGRYEVIGWIGRGGLAEVYKGFDSQTGQCVAIKVIVPRNNGPMRSQADSDADDNLRQRFEQEVEVNRALHAQSTHILPFEGSGKFRFEDVVFLYLVMPLIEGSRTLDDVLEEYKGKYAADKPITGSFVPLWRLLPLMLQASQGLVDAHRANIVHRDFKPSNVLLKRDERGMEWVLVMDFGIASCIKDLPDKDFKRLTQFGGCVGTLCYMSPQQGTGPSKDPKIDAQRRDPRNDTYSFGVTLFQMLTGHLPFPFTDENAFDVWRSVMVGAIEPFPVSDFCEGVPQDLVDLVDRCLKFKLEDRPYMNEVFAVLQRVQLRQPSAGAPSVHTPPKPSSRMVDPEAGPDFHTSDPPPARKTPVSSPSLEIAIKETHLSAEMSPASDLRLSQSLPEPRKITVDQPEPEATKKGSSSGGAFMALLAMVVIAAVIYVAWPMLKDGLERFQSSNGQPMPMACTKAVPSAGASAPGSASAAASGQAVPPPSAKKKPVLFHRDIRDPSSAPE